MCDKKAHWCQLSKYAIRILGIINSKYAFVYFEQVIIVAVDFYVFRRIDGSAVSCAVCLSGGRTTGSSTVRVE